MYTLHECMHGAEGKISLHGLTGCSITIHVQVHVILPPLTYRKDTMWDDVTVLIQPALKKHSQAPQHKRGTVLSDAGL